jgi:hypothetical protein
MHGSGEPLPGVNIMIEGTMIGTVTNIDGQYSLTVDDARRGTGHIHLLDM